MKKRITLTIPNPCHENWDSFTPTGTGGFCGTCSKNVVDFTKMSERELLKYLQNKPSNTCGRFRPDQLKSYLPPDSIRPGFSLLKAGLFSVLMALVSKPAFTQDVAVVQDTEVTSYVKGQVVTSMPQPLNDHTIRGVVMDPESDSPIAGVNIYLKNSDRGTVSDIEGKFEFPDKLNTGDVLYFSFIGYETLEYIVPENAPDLIEIAMTFSSYQIMGELAPIDVYNEQSTIGKWWDKIKSIF